MKHGYLKSNDNNIILMAVFIMLTINTIPRSQLRSLFEFGEWSLLLTFLVMIFFLIKGWLNQFTYDISLDRIYVSFGLLMGVFAYSFLTNGNVSFFSFIEFIFFLFFILSSIRMRWNGTHMKMLGYTFSVAIILFFLHWVINDFPLQTFSSIYRNANYLGVLLFSMLYFLILSVKYSEKLERTFFLVMLLLNLVLIFATSSRAVMIGFAVSVIAWVILKKYEEWFPYLIYIVMAGNLLFVGLFVWVKNTWLGNTLNDLSISIFNKNLFYGRSEIWEGVVSAIMEKPWFGYGFGIRAPDVLGNNLTTHNMYLQLFLEVGVVGFGLFFIFILMIWKGLTSRLHHFVAKWSACFMLGILVYESFELTLFQNNYSIALLQWMIMTVGISFIDEKRRIDFG